MKFKSQKSKATQTSHGSAPFDDLKVVDLITDGLQVALLREMRQQSLDTAVKLFFTFKLAKKTKSGC